MRMSGEFVEAFRQNGLVRTERYLLKVQADRQNGAYPLFKAAIEKILKYGITIEQERFLN